MSFQESFEDLREAGHHQDEEERTLQKVTVIFGKSRNSLEL